MARYFWDGRQWVEFDPLAPRPRPVAPMVIRDVEPYRCIATGERIRGRRHHRDHLRAHRFIEVGNEYNKGLPVDQAPESRAMTSEARKEAITRAFDQVQQHGGRKSVAAEGDDL